MEAALNELGAAGPASNLLHDILAAAGDGGRAPARAPAAGWRSRGLIAAAMLLGVGVVGAVAWLQSRPPQQQPAVAPPQEPRTEQEPKPSVEKPHKEPVYETIICDYSDNRVIVLGPDGKVERSIQDLFGVWDAERLPNGNLLICEFSLSRVRELTRDGRKTVWEFDRLKNPYTATRLASGNTLIADTFGGRVIEVKPDGAVAWEYAGEEGEKLRPFDVEQTDKGTLLICDVLQDRVLEIDRAGVVVWQCRDLPVAHDADRLENGNTLVTLRNKGEVRELDKDGEVVWRVKGLSSPSDADRLPNGNTLVAENTCVREFDKDGKVVATTPMTWAVEANRYAR